ncbi:MAG: tandem-95 repeat protein [Gammaproteobacteria bacterium]|nr:tandem-95 repeat protein [Gammaproteobacteria bacterium]MCP5458469.1 tandem-95 repeat protein [Gammaproteobacteria bacterium]
MPTYAVHRLGLFLVLWLLFPALGWAQDVIYTVLLDTDQDSGTGCAVVLPVTGSTVSGVEQRLSATVDTDTLTITALTLAECSGGAFGAATPLSGTPYPVISNGGINGADVVELAVASSAVAPSGGTVRLYFIAQAAGGDDLLATTDGSATGAPILLTLSSTPVPIPALTGGGLFLLALSMLGVAVWQLRRRSVPRSLSVLLVAITGVVLAATPDGGLEEWVGISPIATDPTGDSARADTDIVAAFAAEMEGVLGLRLDILNIEQQAGGNTPPSFTSTPITTATVGGPYSYNVTGSDPDVGDTLAISAVTLPSWLMLTDNGGGNALLTGAPGAADVGANSVELRLTDGAGGIAVQSFTITVDVTANSPPVAVAQNVSTNEDQAIVITLVGSDVDGDSLAFALASAPNNGTLGGISQLTPTSAQVAYTPNADFNGNDSFTFQVNDGTVDSPAATVTIDVGGVNDPPTANPSTQTTPEDTPITLTLSGSDPDGDALSFAVDSGPSNGTLGAITPLTDTTAQVIYTPNADFNGSDSFTFQVNDGTVDSPAATVTIDVSEVNDPPTANPLAQTTPEDTPITLTLSGSDPDGDALSFAVDSGPSDGTLGAITPLTDTTAEVIYTPNPNFNGSDSFTFKVNDGTVDSAAATVTITIDSVNDNPVANGQTLNTNEDVDLPIVLTGSDLDGDPLTFSIITPPANGTLSGISPINDTSADIAYTPDLNFNGSDSFTFQVDDGNGGTTTAVVDITVNPQADDPVANAQMLTMNEDTALMIVLTGSDPDGDSLTFTIITPPTSGTFTQPLMPVSSTSADLEYMPNADFNGSDSFTFQVDDGNGGTATATVDITIDAVNDDPMADGQSVTTDEDNSVVITLTGGDVDLDALTFAIDTGPTNGSLGAITPLTDTSAQVTYTPTANFNGSDSFTFVVNDGTVDSSAATVSITVNQLNSAPSFTKGPDQTVLEDAGAQAVNAWATAISDSDGGTQTLSFNITNNNNPGLFAAGPAIDATTGTLTYTPSANANGSATITLELMDNGGTANGGSDTSAPQSFDINVTAVNDPPSFTKGPDQTVLEDAGAQIVNPWATGISTGPADEAGQIPTFNITNNNNPGLFAAGPAISSAGVLTYTPAANANGSATITVTLSDNGGTANGGVNTSAAQTFVINVTAVNDPPVALAKNGGNVQANMQRIGIDASLLTGVTDADSGINGCMPTFSVASINTGTNGTVSSVNLTAGTFNFEPSPGFVGAATVTYTVSDDGCPGAATSTPATISFNVVGPVIWFVDPTAASNGTGTLASPFNSLASANTAKGASTNHRIFVYSGMTASGVGVSLSGDTAQATAQWLIGQGATGTDFDTLMGISPPADTRVRPSIGGARPTIQGTLTLNGNNVRAQGFNLLTGSSTGINDASSAISGVTVSQISATSTTAAAVNLSNLSGTVSLTSVSANGASKGLMLNTTSGSFTVTGTSTTDGSGGTIQNIAQRGIELINASNVSLSNMTLINANQSDGAASDGTSGGNENTDENGAIYLDNVSGIDLVNVDINGAAQHGINGHMVTDLDISNSTIQNTGNGIWESGIYLFQLRGTQAAGTDNVFSNSIIRSTGQFNVFVRNNAATNAAPGAMDRLVFNNMQFLDSGASVAGDHVTVSNRDTANFQTVVTGSAFDATPGDTSDSIQVDAGDTSHSDVSITGSSFVDGNLAINISGSGTATTTFNVSNNPSISSRGGSGINIAANSSARMTGTISNNPVITSNFANNNGFGVDVVVDQTGSAVVAIDNNIITSMAVGIRAGARNANTGTADITITDNNISTGGNFAFNAIQLFAGNGSPSESNRTCVNMSGNSTATGFGDDDYFLEQYAGNTFQIQGLSPASGATQAQVESYIANSNVGSPSVDAFGGLIVNYTAATCATPP